MSLTIEAFVNSDDVFIAWRASKPIADCIGFELRRKRNGKLDVVRNRISFSGGEPDPTTPESSVTSPFRRYTWTDHEANTGDKVAYQVAPVIQPEGGEAAVDEAQASDFSGEAELSGEVDKTFECYFNRGLVISQFMSRQLKGDFSGKSLKTFKDGLNDATENKIRLFLGGDLRTRLIGLLDETRKNKGHVFAALFELSDEILISKLTSLGKRAHIVLSNGAHKSRDDDENADSRKTLRDAGCDVHDRMLASGVLGHNKFMVVCDPGQRPEAAWTGSTNWSPTGLCTQINNGILIHDEGVAAEFFDQWARLRDAENATPKDLVATNSEVKTTKTKSANVDLWFTKTASAPEMDAVDELIANAKEGIIFLMFQPGGSSILNAIVDRQAPADGLFVKGVISTMDKNDQKQANVTLIQRGDKKVAKFRIDQPTGLRGVGKWAAEVSRSSFLSQIGFAIVHSKVIVIDPNGKNPVVVTGSHNFSAAASAKNDENLVIVRGNAALAKAYAVEVQSVFDHYNFRAVAASMQGDGKDVSKLMLDPKAWQGAWFRGDKQAELNFWLGN
jgi:phosphatidylserine/phosphatidylglycerophosphate/cardiolipin synthase-like enzyme